ncbi:choline/carnitine O-acyltransferase [Cryptosporangium aurantiacum]|uniref:Carnitine O-acetyltransferase n=1 Tax=Cryptosporangium aurantiacum TaxID=134849 RepID=A0A1M7RGL0_9ACTN|nr:choline/carnitine O-acyltransferase [Cryptosporangium aurantiacum]SHN45301.1 carnitine O-acetyltransferase [Cryptosporangium aurantiacum]
MPEWSTRTFGNEDLLPRVPLPTLEASCERFLQWCAPLLTPEQLAQTEAEVAAFLAPDGPGRPLHQVLEKFDATEGVHSWLDTFWPYRYLGRRDRIALNANFFFLFADSGQTQVERATALIAGALAFKHSVDAETLAPAVVRGVPQTMEQNKYLFSTTRIPGEVQDTVRGPYGNGWDGPSRARHILVLHRGVARKVDVLGPGGEPYALDEIAGALQSVLDAGSDAASHPVGHLTTKARAAWAADRQALLALDPANAAALDDVESALFCVCLEDVAPTDDLIAADHLLHGDSGNRWFDKAVSFVVFANGRAGINVEHCELDGTTILRFVDAVLGSSAAEHAVAAGARSQGSPTVAPVTFVLDDALRTAVRAAGADFADYAAATATTVLTFTDFGSDRAKQLRMSPDAFVQMAYQLAHRRAKGLTGATYESIATRQYQRGRTEAMRVVTPEAVEFVAAMDDPDATPDARRAAFRAAAEAHVRRAKECQAIQAPEQHLWELQLIQRRGEAIGVDAEPALFRSPGWTILRDDYLSTSSAPSTSIDYFGFGSTSSQCIGVGYVLLPDRLAVHLSTPRAVADGMERFATELGRALGELADLL